MKFTKSQIIKQAYKEMAYLCPMIKLGVAGIDERHITLIPYLNNKPLSEFKFVIAREPISKYYIAFCVLDAARKLRLTIIPSFNHDFIAVYSGNKAKFYLNGKRISDALGNQIENTTYAPDRKTTLLGNKKIVTLKLISYDLNKLFP